MAIARTRTLLSLDEWAKIMEIDPVHFNQIVIGDPSNTSDDDLDPATLCDSPTLQHSYQMANALGREEIARAIATAEQKIMQYTGYALAPTWAWNELVDTTRPGSPELYGLSGLNARGQFQTVRSRWGMVLDCGRETKTLISASAAIVYTDTDGDGYFETATIAVPVDSSVLPTEVALYYPGKNADDRYEIRPITVSIANGVATIVCHRHQLVLESLLTQWEAGPVQGLNNALFLTTVDVYRHWTDSSVQATTEWEQPVCLGCGGTGCVACQGAASTACLSIRDSRLGYLAAQPLQLGLWAGGRQPDHLLINYRHGYQDLRPYDASGQLQNRMSDEWAFAVAYFTCAILDRPICSCQGLQQQFRYWQDDMSMNISNAGGESTSRHASRKYDECPFGSARGSAFAWDTVQRLKIGEGLAV